MYVDRVEDDPSGDPEMCVAYVGYGTANQVAYRMERAMILTADLPTSFADFTEREAGR